MQETFIKLDRSLLRHRYFENANILKAWIWCLMKASHADHQQLVGLQTVALLPGEFVTGREAAGREMRLPSSTAWRLLKLFESDGKVNIKSNNKFSVISIVDYGAYNLTRYQTRQPVEQQVDSKWTTDGQQVDTNNKGNKGDKVNKGEKALALSDHEMILNDKSAYLVPLSALVEWQELFPGVDVPQQLRSMTAWCKVNTSKRKTRRGIEKFIVAWLSKEQDKGPRLAGLEPKPDRETKAETIREGNRQAAREFCNDLP